MLQSFLSSSYAPYIVILILILIIISLVATIIRVILRSFIRRIKYSVAFFITLGLFAFFIGKSFVSPFTSASKNSLVSERAITDAVSSFKGVYNKQLPLVAWKFKELNASSNANSDMDQLVDQVFDDASTASSSGKSTGADPILIRISYFPLGSVVVSYNIQSNTFSLEKGLDQNKGSGLIESLFGSANPNLLNELPKAK